MENSGNLENKVEHVLISKVKLIWTIVLATIAVAGLFYKIQIDNQTLKNELANYEKTTAQIQNIKDNDLHTIQTKLDDQGNQINQLKEQIIKLQTIIEERLPKK